MELTIYQIIMALKIGKGFKDKIASLISGKLSEKFTERFKEEITNTRAILNKAAFMLQKLLNNEYKAC